MSVQSINKLKRTATKITESESVEFKEEKFNESASHLASSITPRQNNFILEEVGEFNSRVQVNTLFPDDQTMPLHTAEFAPGHMDIPTELFTQPREDIPHSSDHMALIEEGETIDLSPQPNSKTSDRPSFMTLKREDSTLVVCKDFTQIEKHLSENNPLNENASTVVSLERTNAGMQSMFNSTHVPSKFAPATETGKKKTWMNSSSRIVPLRDSTTLETGEAKKKWNKLNNVVQSVAMMKRETVKNISHVTEVHHEIESFQLKQLEEKTDKIWDISKQHFAREAFQAIRRVQLFCESAAIGAPRHLKIMKELIQTDPKRYILEPDDPVFILNHKNNIGHTPLYIAAKNGNVDVVRLLIESKANPLIGSKISHQDKGTELAIQVAARWGHAEIVEYLIKTCKHDDKILQQCIESASNQSIKVLIQKSLKRKPAGSWKGLFRCFVGE